LQRRKLKIFPIILAAILFIALVLATVINYLYINNVGNTLKSLAEQTRENPSGCIALSEYWEKHKDIVAISVSNIEIERLSDAIDSLVAYVDSDCFEEFRRSIELVINAIESIRRLERISTETIL
jgi:hypothetical protein